MLQEREVGKVVCLLRLHVEARFFTILFQYQDAVDATPFEQMGDVIKSSNVSLLHRTRSFPISTN